MKKKMLIVLIAFVLVSLVACSNDNTDSTNEVLNTEEAKPEEVTIDKAEYLEVEDGFTINETINDVAVNIVIPNVTENVLNGDLINTDIPYAGLDGYDSKEDLEMTLSEYNEENPYSKMTSVTINYELTKDNLNISVLAIKTEISFEASGNLTSYICYYYDNNTNKQISNTKTLEMHGYTMNDAYEEIITKNETIKEFYHPEDANLGTISAVYYYFDEDGTLECYNDFWM
ncbi:MAG: hypothetical protein JJE03_00760 [Peptostreptococcaceae bacterium]|nr:hypothetical protein [Peptostreptococcaceae bacterium]